MPRVGAGDVLIIVIILIAGSHCMISITAILGVVRDRSIS
jgi:hypothetical protein